MTNQKLKNEKIKLSRRLYRYEDDVDRKNERIRDASEDILKIFMKISYKVEEIEAVLRSQLFNIVHNGKLLKKIFQRHQKNIKKLNTKHF